MPNLTSDQLTLGLAIVGAVALLCVLTTLFLAARLRKVRKHYALMRGEGEPRDIIATVNRSLKHLSGLDKRVDGIVTDLEQQAAVARFAIQRFGLVRYNAFAEMGGQLSFSAAFLDDHGDGVVITSINGRTETRTYAKDIRNLTSSHNLSDEERKAIDMAASGTGRVEAGVSASR